MGELSLNKNVTFLVGENGIGKSTLIEAIAVSLGFNPEGGTRNFNFSTNDSRSKLSDKMVICKGIKHPKDGFFLRAESMYNAATYIDTIGACKNYGGQSLHEQSHGESFLSIVEHRFGGNGIYILDEPEAALSPASLLRLMCYMRRLVNDGSQFIIATHSPILMTFPGAEVLELSDKGIKSVNYKDTEHFMITKRFMLTPEKMLAELFDE